MNNPSDNIRTKRKDLTPYLFHYVKGEKPVEALRKILDEHTLKSNNAYICFTETPLTSSKVLFDYMGQYKKPFLQPYGIGISRDLLFQKGARNIIYSTQDEINCMPKEIQWRCLELDVLNYDFTWFREWRLPFSSFDFLNFKEDLIVIAPTRDEVDDLVINRKIEPDWDCEPGEEPIINALVETKKREWKSISFEDLNIKEIDNDFVVSGTTQLQAINSKEERIHYASDIIAGIDTL
ncbi:MAG: hypothetical protein EGQ00_16045 [Parabacteroides johnsonii]|jgi:hypothetical protein|nr:hypothetical protein [Parabacteroides johnsonii]